MRETIRLYRGDFVRREGYASISVADGIAVDDESGHAVLIVPLKNNHRESAPPGSEMILLKNDPGLGEIKEEFGLGEGGKFGIRGTAYVIHSILLANRPARKPPGSGDSRMKDDFDLGDTIPIPENWVMSPN